MVSISRAAPDASRIWSVAPMISGPIPSPYATVIGVLVNIVGTSSIVALLDTAQQDPVVFFYKTSLGIPPKCGKHIIYKRQSRREGAGSTAARDLRWRSVNQNRPHPDRKSTRLN